MARNSGGSGAGGRASAAAQITDDNEGVVLAPQVGVGVGVGVMTLLCPGSRHSLEIAVAQAFNLAYQDITIFFASDVGQWQVSRRHDRIAVSAPAVWTALVGAGRVEHEAGPLAKLDYGGVDVLRRLIAFLTKTRHLEGKSMGSDSNKMISDFTGKPTTQSYVTAITDYVDSLGTVTITRKAAVSYSLNRKFLWLWAYEKTKDGTLFLTVMLDRELEDSRFHAVTKVSKNRWNHHVQVTSGAIANSSWLHALIREGFEFACR